MSISFLGDQVAVNVPQMIDDSKYVEHTELLPGIKQNIRRDEAAKMLTLTIPYLSNPKNLKAIKKD